MGAQTTSQRVQPSLSQSGMRTANHCRGFVREVRFAIFENVLPRSSRRTGAMNAKKTTRKGQHNLNYQRNLPLLTGVPTITPWVTKLFSSVPMKKRLAR